MGLPDSNDDERHTMGMSRRKRLSEAAWSTLCEALSVFWWYKSDFEQFLRRALGDWPRLLALVDSNLTKRQVASELIAALSADEDRYQDVAIDLLIRLSQVDPRFPHLARLDDAPPKVAAAEAALKDVIAVVEQYSALTAARERVREELAAEAEQAERRRSHGSVLAELYITFIELQGSDDAHARGKALEDLLNRLFALFDLYPRAAYRMDHEQIDGAFTFQNADYLLEARWWKTPLEPKHLNDFKVKIESKAKHTLGLCVAVGGFTGGAIEKHSATTPLIAMDGGDLVAVLEDRISLFELLERKRRHAAETGSPML